MQANDITPKLQRPQPNVTLEMAERDWDNVKDKTVKAYQQENPEVKPYYQETASRLLSDLQMGFKGSRDAGIDPETRNVTKMIGQKRQQSGPINQMREAGLDYDQIQNGLERIIEDNGKENTVTAKRVELFVHDATVNGYDSIVDGRVPENTAYHYRGMGRQQLLSEQERLENSFVPDNEEVNAAIIKELELIDGLLAEMPADISPQQPKAGDAVSTVPVGQNETAQQQEATISNQQFADYDLDKVAPGAVQWLERVGSMSGLNVRIVKGLEHNANGMFDGRGTILLNGDNLTSSETVWKVCGHEVYHAMKGTDAHKDLQDLAWEWYRLENPDATQQDMLNEKIAQYAKSGVTLDNDAAWDEIGASFVEEVIVNEEAAKRVIAKRPNLAQRILRTIQQILQRFTGKLSAVEQQQREILQKTEKIYRNGLQSMKYEGVTQDGQRSYSLKMGGYFPDNTVSTDDVSLLNIKNIRNKNEVIAKVRDYLQSRYLSTEQMSKPIKNIDTGMDIEIRMSGIRETFGKDSYYLNLSGEEKLAKLAVIPKLANLIKYGEVRAAEAGNYHNPNSKVRYAYLKAPLEIDGDSYIVNMDIRRSPNGENRFYIHSLKINKDAVQDSAGPNRNGERYRLMNQNTTSFVEDSVSQNEQNVNEDSGVRYSLPKNEKYLSQSAENLENFMRESQVVNEDGSPKIVYAGHGNSSLFGSVFDPKKATAGGFYFTENPDIASSYANDKLGIKENYKNGSEYRFANAKGNLKATIDKVVLTSEQQQILDEFLDEDMGLNYDDYVRENAPYDRDIAMLRYNGGKANLQNVYKLLESLGYTSNGYDYRTGKQINTTFEDLLDSMGIRWDSYNRSSPGVFPVYLNIKNPLDTSQPFPQHLMNELEYAARNKRFVSDWNTLNETQWTKNYPLKNWIEDIKNDDGSTDWATQIPKEAKKIMQAMGYDGIVDKGGKQGGLGHTVWIAFEPNQVKSATGNRGTYDSSKKDIRYSLNNPQQDNIDRYGAIPPGENPTGNNRDIQMPKRTADDNKVGRFNRTAAEDGKVDDQTVEALMRALRTYTPSSNQKQLDHANHVLDSVGWEEAAQSFQSRYKSGEKMTANDIALGERCIMEAQKVGDYQKAAELIGDVAALGAELGQAVQALRLLKRLTPEGRLMALKRVQNRINANLREKAKGKQQSDGSGNIYAADSNGQIRPNLQQQTLNYPQVELSAETARRVLEAQGPQAQADAWDRAIQEFAEQVPATLADKINAWRYLSMLSNTRTHIRNVIGNSVMRTVMGFQHIMQVVAEQALPEGAERHRALRAPKEYKEFAEWDYENVAKRMLQSTGSRYNDAASMIKRQQRVFQTKPLEAWRKFNSDLLEGEDLWFKRSAYIDAMAHYMAANNMSPSILQKAGATSTYEQAQKYALHQAQRATFQEMNWLANELSRIENKNLAGKLGVGALMPFKKTPLNIMKRGSLEYSPVGIAKGIKKMAVDVKRGEATPAEALENLTEGLTGTAIMMLGYFMMGWGLLATGDDGDDQRKATYDSQMGDQTYAFVFPDGSSYTLDWLSPSVMPLLVGAELWQQLDQANEDDNTNIVMRGAMALTKISNPLLEMSCMQSLSSALSSYSNSTGEIFSNVFMSAIKSYGGQFVPAVAGAAARTVDDTVRSSYASKDSPYTKDVESFLRQQRSKIPVLSQQNEASIDVWGNERKREAAGEEVGDIAMRVIHNFINPGTYSSNKRTALDDKLEALYEATGNSSVFPKTATSTINATKQNPAISLTPHEYSRFATTQGQKSKQYVTDFTGSSAYQNLDDDVKAKIVGELYNLAAYQARKQALKNRSYDYSDDTYEKALDSGVKPYEYYATKERFGGKWSDYDVAVKYANAADKIGLSDEKFVSYYDAMKEIEGKGQKEGRIAYLNQQVKNGNLTREQYWYLRMKFAGTPSKTEKAACPYRWMLES